MIGVFNTITINNRKFFRPSNFTPAKEDVFRGEYTTCTGELIADRIGWKYSDMTLAWDILTSDMLAALTALTGTATLKFNDSDGEHTETIIRKGFKNTATRTTGPGGTALWTNIEVEITFLTVHN